MCILFPWRIRNQYSPGEWGLCWNIYRRVERSIKGVAAAQQLLHTSHYCRAELNCIKFDSSARVDNWFKRRTIPARNSVLVHFNFVRHLAILSNSVAIISQLYSLPEVALHSDWWKIKIRRSYIGTEFDTNAARILESKSHQSQSPGRSGIYWESIWLY